MTTQATVTRAGLGALLDVPDVRQFLEHDWPERARVVHGAVTRLPGLADLPEFADPQQLFALPCESVRADFHTLDGKTRSIFCTPDDARKLHEAGSTIYLLNLAVPSFEPWVDAVQAELSLPPGMVQVNAFASRKGIGLRAHYDSQDNFMVQVRGTKRWKIAPNRHVRFPTINYGIGQPIPPGLNLQAPDGFPAEMPADHQVIDLQPGSVLFLPRGYWHEAETIAEESIHLVLEVRVPTWADVFTFVLKASGALSTPEWREPVLNLWSGHGIARADLGEQLVARVTRLVQQLAEGGLDLAQVDVAAALRE